MRVHSCGRLMDRVARYALLVISLSAALYARASALADESVESAPEESVAEAADTISEDAPKTSSEEVAGTITQEAPEEAREIGGALSDDVIEARGDESEPIEAETLSAEMSERDATRVRAHTGLILGAEVYISDIADRALLASAFGYAVTGTHRWPNGWSLGFRLEHDLWVRYELGHGVDPGAISAAAVVSRLSLRDRLRTSLMLGPSFLLFDTGLDDAGSVGFYGEARPLGVLFHFPRMSLILDPFTISLVAPVLSQIPLLRVAYRSVIQFEFGGRR